MVKAYKRSDKVQLSKNFKLDEFKCKCGKCDPILLDTVLIDWLQKIRDHFGKSVNVNSGYRCKAHNASPRVNGSPTSHHVKGMAADIRVSGVLPREVAKYAESIGIQRIGLYDNFVHIGSDTRKKFWLGHSGTPVETFGGRMIEGDPSASPQDDGAVAQDDTVAKTVSIKLPVLKKGAKGEAVRVMQTLLIGEGYGIVADGSFGGKTLNALQCFQEDAGLTPDGSCGKATWSKLLGVET
jgi:hypothetical protein